MSNDKFVCECDEGARSACDGLEFYREVEGKRYCVLHCPVQDKVDDFNERFRRKLSSFEYNFRGVYFPTDVSFAGVSFVSATDFSKATFSANAYFEGATFNATAAFRSAKFSAAAHFSKATFSADVDFRSAKFSAAAYFSNAMFSANAYFRSAKFSAAAYFSNAMFSANAYFRSTKFIATAYFSKVAFRANADFRSTKFSANAEFSEATFSAVAFFNSAMFSTIAVFSSATFSSHLFFKSAKFSAAAYFRSAKFSATAYFDSAKFGATAVFSKAKFSAATSFSKVLFSGAASFEEATFGAAVYFEEATFGAAAYFRSAKIESYLRFTGKADSPVFTDAASLDLQLAQITKPEQLIFHTVRLRPHWFVNADARKFEFTNVNWVVQDELRPISKRENHHRLLSIAYRQLATNAEDNNRYGEAAQFRYASMEARRLERRAQGAFWSLDWWYWLVSGYGERIPRATLALIFILLLSCVPYRFVGFAPTKFLDQDKVGVPIRASAKYENKVIQFIVDTATACVYSLETASLQKPEPRPTTLLARFFVGLETILAPLQAALLALAIRRRFMR